MGKRIYRIFTAQLPGKKDLLLGKTVDVITRQARTVRGRLEEISAEALMIRNGRGAEERLPLYQVAEVVFDEEAPY